MRILEVILSPMIGGAETLVASLAKEWRDAGHSVDIVALDPSPSPEQWEKSRASFGEDVEVLSTVFRAFSAPHQITRVLTLGSLLRKGRYDVVHAHSHIPNMYARLATLGLGYSFKLIITLHSASTLGDYSDIRSRVAEKLLLRRTSAIVAVSLQSRVQYLSLFPAAESKTHVIPNGVKFDRPITPRVSAGPRRFVAVGRLTRQKDYLTLLRGFDRFASSQPTHPTLTIIGPVVDVEYWDQIHEQLGSLQSSEQIHFLGPRTDIYELLESFDVLVHAALQENHPITIVEAAGHGLPIVASGISAIETTIGNDALYFAPGNADDLSIALNRCVDTWTERSATAIRLAERIRTMYSIESCAKQYMDLFDSCG